MGDIIGIDPNEKYVMGKVNKTAKVDVTAVNITYLNTLFFTLLISFSFLKICDDVTQPSIAKNDSIRERENTLYGSKIQIIVTEIKRAVDKLVRLPKMLSR
jgi:hypothetical protein